MNKSLKKPNVNNNNVNKQINDTKKETCDKFQPLNTKKKFEWFSF